MTLPVLDRDETLLSVADSTRRWTELIRTVRDPSVTAIGHWSIRDVAVHTSHIYGLWPELIAGARSPIENHLRIGEEWDAKVRGDGEQDLNAIADRIDLATKEFLDAAIDENWTKDVWWHGGLRVPVYTLAGILINEAEVHGRDVAQAEDRPWSIAREKAIKAIVGLFPLLPSFINGEEASGMRAIYELRLRGGPQLFITVQDGSASLDATPKRADCHLSVDPVEYLMIGFGRRSQWLPIATGKVAAWGRKPWLALKFSKLFTTP